MFVDTLRVYKRPDFSLRSEKNFDARLVGRVSIYTVHIGRIYLVIRNQNKAEVSILGVEMFLLGHIKFLLNVNCGYYMYVVSRQ